MTQRHSLAPLASWLIEPLSAEVAESIERLRRAEDVRHAALLPDVHLANEVCVGAVVATNRLIYPAAVGGDIGCGMATVRFNAEANLLREELAAARVLAGLYQVVPANKHRRPRDLPSQLASQPLSSERLTKVARRDGQFQFGTLGRGNHFLEFQADQDGLLWVAVHSGSRAMGQAISRPWLRQADSAQVSLHGVDANSPLGQSYLGDAAWARLYAHESRLAMLHAAVEMMRELFGVHAEWDTLIHRDHNHVDQEKHFGERFWVHRKGAQRAADGELGIVPGSMGTVTFHVSGRGCPESLRSCAHGAGRKLSRGAARAAVSNRQLQNQMRDVWFDHRRINQLVDEAPAAYKDVRAVMRAQRPLVRVVRELTPLLAYKGW